MSALLKAADAHAQSSVRAFREYPPVPIVFPSASNPCEGDTDVLPDPAHVSESEELHAVIADLRERLASAVSDADEREDAAFERGRREGEDLATGEADKRLDLLRQSLVVLQQTHADRLAECELLALQIARAALERLFGDGSLRADLIAATVAQRLATIKRDLVQHLRVSPRDFRCDEELQALASSLLGLAITQDDTLEAGACMLDLRLGTIDLGLPGQWAKLAALFEDMAEEDARP